jgi:hypothetical protein
MTPLANFVTTFVHAFCSDLAILMKIAPESMFEAICVLPLRRQLTIPMEGSEQAMPNPFGTIICKKTSVPVPYFTGFKINFRNIEIRGSRFQGKPSKSNLCAHTGGDYLSSND